MSAPGESFELFDRDEAASKTINFQITPEDMDIQPIEVEEDTIVTTSLRRRNQPSWNLSGHEDWASEGLL